jgi:hypothetical protein
MNFLIYLLIFLTIAGIIIIRQVEIYFEDSSYKILIRFITIAIIINIIIFSFISSSFGVVKSRRGPQGPRGNRGDKGYEGIADNCAVCGKQTNDIAFDKLEERKRTDVIIQKPLLPDKNVSLDKWFDILGKYVKIYRDINGNKCGLQFDKNGKAILDNDGNADIFQISKEHEGNKIYIQNKVGKHCDKFGENCKFLTDRCSLAISNEKNLKKNKKAVFDCGGRFPLYISGVPLSFYISGLNDNEISCNLKSLPDKKLINLVFNCVDEGDNFYLEVLN